MVAYNPVLRGKWTLKKFRATILNDIWPEVLFFTLFSCVITTISMFSSTSLAISSRLLTVLGVVLGLVISFRTSTAYERFQEGRKLWANIVTASRNLAIIFWIHVPNERVNEEGKQIQSNLHSIVEKKTMINLVQALSVAIKHFLRGEDGVYYEDLYPLVSFLPKYSSPRARDLLPLWQASEEYEHPYRDTQPRSSTDPSGSAQNLLPLRATWLKRAKTFDPEKALPFVHSHRPLKPARNPPESTIYDYLPILLVFRWIANRFKQKEYDPVEGLRKRVKRPNVGDSNVPLEIIIWLSNYYAFLMRHNLLQSAIATGVFNNLSLLQDTVTNLDRIATTPLPFAYQAHLRMSLWLWLLLFPFQILSDFEWLTIPITVFVSFLLLGFLEIGQEIENPFNYDANDLDLDGFCLSLQRELQEITAHPATDPDKFIFSSWNQPFAPADRRTAEEFLTGQTEYQFAEREDAGLDWVYRTLLWSWRDTDDLTRERKK